MSERKRGQELFLAVLCVLQGAFLARKGDRKAPDPFPWQKQTPQARLSALVAIREDMLKVKGKRRRGPSGKR